MFGCSANACFTIDENICIVQVSCIHTVPTHKGISICFSSWDYEKNEFS